MKGEMRVFASKPNIQPQQIIQKQNNQKQSSDIANGVSNMDQEEQCEMVTEVNDQLSRPDEQSTIGGSGITEIIAYQWKLGYPVFKVKWSSGDTSWETLKDMREDQPRMTARYILENKVSRSKRGGDRVLQWAKKVERDMDRAVRRIVRLYDLFLDDNDNVRYVRRSIRGKKKHKKPKPQTKLKYGIKIPRTVEEAIEIDRQNGNTL